MKTESLETLNLGHNPVTNEGIHLVKDGLLKSKSLLKLGLSGTKVTCEGMWIVIFVFPFLIHKFHSGINKITFLASKLMSMVIAPISMNIVPYWDIYGRSQARIRSYPNKGQYPRWDIYGRS